MESLSDKDFKVMLKHLDLVLEKNQITNITSIADRDKALSLHIEDSLFGLECLEEAPSGPYADIGSGGGYPGIPLAIASKRPTTLIESVQRKARLLRFFIQELALDSYVQVYSERAEELACQAPASFSVVSARAVSQLPSLLELASPLLREGGRLICYKAHIDKQELDRALRCKEKLAMHYRAAYKKNLSYEDETRTIVVFEKRGEPLVTLPRRNGMAQKRPYA